MLKNTNSIGYHATREFLRNQQKRRWFSRTDLLLTLHPNDIVIAVVEEWLVVDVTGKYIINHRELA